MLRNLDLRIGVLEEQRVGDRRFFETEEGADLIFAALVASARTRHREKLRLYAAVLAGAATYNRPEEVEPEALLDSLIGLTPIEVSMLRVIHECRTKGWEVTVAAFPAEAQPQQGLHIARLTAAGFIGTFHVSTLGGGVNATTPTSALTALMALAPTLGEDHA
jgi:hypothetical protein